MSAQGRMANSSGDKAEQVLCSVLRANGWTFKRQVVIGRSIYDHALRADIVCDPRPALPTGLVIECKWQSSSGSVDEKFPYLGTRQAEFYDAFCDVGDIHQFIKREWVAD